MMGRVQGQAPYSLEVTAKRRGQFVALNLIEGIFYYSRDSYTESVHITRISEGFFFFDGGPFDGELL